MILAKSYGAKTMTDDIRPIRDIGMGHLRPSFWAFITPAAHNAAETEAVSRAYDNHMFLMKNADDGDHTGLIQFIEKCLKEVN